MTTSDPARRIRRPGAETAALIAWFAAHLGYLLWHQEGELVHWLTLVVVPLVIVYRLGAYRSLRELLASIGLEEKLPRRGLILALVLAGLFQVLQLMNRSQRAELFELMSNPVAWLLPIVAFVLLLGTAATTEEIFFRGLIQGRLAAWSRSQLLALTVATLMFIVYHIPYAYLNPAWPSAGDPGAAIRLAAVNGSMGGLTMGIVYWRSGGRLLPAIVLHAAIDLIPATRLLGELLA